MTNKHSQTNMEKNTEKRINKNIISVKPFIYTSSSISVVCIKMFILLFLQFVMLGITKSYNALFVVLTAFMGSVCTCALNYLIYKEPIYNAWPIIIQGVIIGFLLPDTFPLVIVFFITFLILFISRCMIFKSINSWINVSVIAIIIAWFIGSNYFPNFLITSDLIRIKNPCVQLIQNGTFKIASFDSTITQFLNSTIFRWLKINIPEGLITLLWDTHSSIPAFRFNLLTIIASIILVSDNSIQITIPSLFLLVYGILVRLLAPVFFGGLFNTGDILLAFFTSGTLFTAIFLLQWFGTTPITVGGKFVFGILSGILAFIITGCGTSPIGMVYTVLVCNMLNIIIRFFEEKNNKIILNKVLTKTIDSYSKEAAQ